MGHNQTQEGLNGSAPNARRGFVGVCDRTILSFRSKRAQPLFSHFTANDVDRNARRVARNANIAEAPARPDGAGGIISTQSRA